MCNRKEDIPKSIRQGGEVFLAVFVEFWYFYFFFLSQSSNLFFLLVEENILSAYDTKRGRKVSYTKWLGLLEVDLFKVFVVVKASKSCS